MTTNSLFQPFVREPVHHLFRLLARPQYRRLCWLRTRYGGAPRFVSRHIHFGEWKFEVPDVASFLSAFEEIFLKEIYSFSSKTDSPLVFDCGANIGLSVLYFKQLYPKARIIAYEADPKIFKILQANVTHNRLNGVTLVPKAVWSSETILQFSSEGADGGRINTGGDPNLLDVRTLRLRDELAREQVDFLKVDIEGAEVEVLKDCEPMLSLIPRVFVEFHSFKEREPQELGTLIQIFERQGFRSQLHSVYISQQPFRSVGSSNKMDMRLNCFFYKK